MSTGEQEEHHEPTVAAGARARRAVIMVAASIVLCIGLLIVLVLGLVMFTGAGLEKKRQQDLAASTCLAPEVAAGVAGDGSVAVPVAGIVTSIRALNAATAATKPSSRALAAVNRPGTPAAITTFGSPIVRFFRNSGKSAARAATRIGTSELRSL